MREIFNVAKQDFKWSAIGDFIVEDGDVSDTREMLGLGFFEEVERRIASSFNDWKLDVNDGANLDLFRDRINEENTWQEIADSISFSFTSDFFLGTADFKVYVAPVGINEVAVRVEFSDNIRRQIDPRLDNIKVVYDLTGQGPFIMR